jgi:hypothetical protein
MFNRIFKGVLPAVLGAAVVSPVSTLADISIVKSAKSGDTVKSVVESCKEFRVDTTCVLNFMIGLSALLSTNFLNGHKKQILVGTGCCIALSAIKDILLLDKDVPTRTKSLFVLRDGLANLPCLLYPGGSVRNQFMSITIVQIPCTLINSYAIDYCLFSNREDEYMCNESYERLSSHFLTSYFIRLPRSAFSIGLSTWINYNLKRILKFK